MASHANYTFLNFKVLSFNCRGLNSYEKRSVLFEKFRKSDATIICLQETKLKPNKEFLYRNEWKSGPSFFNSMNGGKGGTAILFNTHEVKILKFLVDQNSRIIVVDVEINGTVIHVINTYFPNDKKEQYTFICSLHPFFHSNFPIVWSGDHNISTNNLLDRYPQNLEWMVLGKIY